VNRAGVLLDTGPLVALLSRADANHARAAVVRGPRPAPAHLRGGGGRGLLPHAARGARRPGRSRGPGPEGVFEIGLRLDREWSSVEGLLRRHAARPVSLADASLIRCAERHQEPRILAFDGAFAIYRWARSRRFQVLGQG
jgi:hypothetical protein